MDFERSKPFGKFHTNWQLAWTCPTAVTCCRLFCPKEKASLFALLAITIILIIITLIISVMIAIIIH